MVTNRWWIEHSYKELKDELGFDHFEGRSWRGLHHHVTLTLLAYQPVEKVNGRRMRPTATRETLGVSRGRPSGQRPGRALSTDS